jgi:glycosyltransferase involved in cell wall biosynthesis
VKIAWFTPFSAKSAIGRYSGEVVAELAKFVSVDLWHPEASDERPVLNVRRMRFRQASEIDSTVMSKYDLIVYNLGNHFPFHGEIFRVAQKTPGLIVLHDIVMHHFFAAYYLERLKSPRLYTEAMERAYGERGRLVAETALTGKSPRLWETDEVAAFPLVEEAVRGALAVVTHSDFQREIVERQFAGPVRKIPLPYQPLTSTGLRSRSELGLSEDQLLLVTIGHVNANKRIESVIRALAGIPEPTQKFVYVVLGPSDSAYHRQLMETIRSNHLESRVRLLGYVDDDTLHSYVHHADICLNLRFPVFEGASASLIEEMWYGKSIIVTDTGFCSELPSDAVRKITPQHEEEELSRALLDLLSNSETRAHLGRRAHEVASSEFHAKHYVQELLKFFWIVRSCKPALELADRIARELDGFGVSRDMEIATSIADEAYKLLFGD